MKVFDALFLELCNSKEPEKIEWIKNELTKTRDSNLYNAVMVLYQNKLFGLC